MDFEGEVESDKDIIGRVKFDIFYIENWSLFLDIKIIIKTMIRAIQGDEKSLLRYECISLRIRRTRAYNCMENF